MIIQNEENEKKKRCEELLLKEYEHLMSMIHIFYDMLQRSNVFYFTVFAFLIPTFFLIAINENLVLNFKILFIIILIVFHVAITFSWWGHSERTYVKLMSKLERARHIEAYFAKEYGEFMHGVDTNPKVFKSKHYFKNNFLKECFQNFTFSAKHLDQNQDCKGNCLNFSTKRNSFFVTKFPFVLSSILLFGMIISTIYLFFYNPFINHV